jgi:hypothetical protein
MLGPKRVGKTITAMALSHWLSAEGASVIYDYVMEPRSSYKSINKEQWADRIKAGANKVAQPGKVGVVIMDSMTYTIAALAQVAQATERSTVTYKGGLSPTDILGVLFHDEMAKELNIALVGTVNSDLFPVVDKFEGACEGEVTIIKPGEFFAIDRRTRKRAHFTAPDESVAFAFEKAGYLRVDNADFGDGSNDR